MKIIYTRGNRTETLASLATLRKILGRFVAHRVFYEVSSRNKRGHEFFSAKNVFVVGSIEVVNRDYLTITIFDGNSQAHSIEILNPATMRIYDEMPGKGFAVSFISDSETGVESRCYLRDEGEDADGGLKQSALEKITLPATLRISRRNHIRRSREVAGITLRRQRLTAVDRIGQGAGFDVNRGENAGRVNGLECKSQSEPVWDSSGPRPSAHLRQKCRTRHD